ncbi:hypothetical protein AGDE_14297 [Angomonas deanei]|nr:hypothetical protein AGDE_14297 [Angomonas deanei]|eukprot:EPY21081.1 hypothetical protein AGDE_14297 [Angomonas deanei]
MVHCGCFVSLHPLNILAFSSSFVNRKGQSPHRLTLWDLDHDCLLWRGGTELLVSMCTFTGEAAFAACTEDKISLFSVQQTDGTGDGKPKVVVLSRGCGSVDELQDSKYVECLCPKTAGDTFTVLTSLGYLVSHDKQSGAVVRWMNCKVSPVVSANFVDDFVVLAGSLTRFFKQDSWEFSGKIKLNAGVERPSDTLTNVFSAVVGCGGNSYLIFTANGEMGLYSAVIDKTPTKVQFKRHYLHTPVTSCDGIVDWYFPANTTDGSWALFTSTQLTLFDHTLCTKRLIPHFATSSAFISEHNIVVCFLADTNELVAYNTLAGWGEWARVKLRSPVVSIASSPSSQLACLHDDGYKISYFTVRCEVLGGGTQSFVFEPLEGSTHLGEPLLQLVCAEDNNFYGVGSKQVYHLANENVLNLKGKVVCVSKLGADLLICQETGCVRYKTLTQECVVVSSSKGIQSMSVHPKRPVVALAMRTEITIYELFSDVKPRIVETIFYSMSNAPSGGEPFTTIQSVAWEDDNRLLVLDASGGLSEYTLENVRFSQGKPPTRDQRLAPPER